MSTKARVFGMDQEIQNKIKAKFDPQKAHAALHWIGQLSGDKMSEDVQASLKSGVALCKALNRIKPNTVPRVNTGAMPFVQRENIANYCTGCKAIGMREGDLFVTQDLFEGDNLTLVVDNIFALGAIAKTISSFHGPHLQGATTLARENKREFSEEQLRQANTIVPMQSSGSLETERENTTDQIVRYGKIGQHMGDSSSEVPQHNQGAHAYESEHRLDHIVRQPVIGQRNEHHTTPTTTTTAPKKAAGGGGGGGARFCAECGHALGGARFCSECGAAA